MAQQCIVGYHTGDENHWVAELDCGHFQHVRHDPPVVSRPWVLTQAGRTSANLQDHPAKSFCRDAYPSCSLPALAQQPPFVDTHQSNCSALRR